MTEKVKSTREVAREIAKRYTREGTGYADRLYQLAYAIEQAIGSERERCAKIADAEAEGHTRQAKEYAGYGQMRWAEDNYNAAAICRDVATAIRNEERSDS